MGSMRRFLSSIVESKDAIEEKEEITKKLEKILESINRDDDDKSQLVSLVEDFHESYQTLHGRYGHLIEKIKTSSLRNKKDGNNDGSSSSNSSDSDDEYKSLKKQVHVWKLKNKDIEDKVTLLNSELNAAQHFNSLVSNKLSEEENKVGVFKLETENLKAEVGRLSDENADLKEELEKTCHLMKNQVEKKSLENAELVNEIQILNLKLEASIKHVSDLEMRFKNLNEEKNGLHLENVKILSRVEELKKESDEKMLEINCLKSNLEELKTGCKVSEEKISELIKNLKIKDDEKELLSKEYEEKISELIKNLKIKDDEKELLSKEYEEKISELIKNLKIKDDEKELLSKEYEEKISELIKNLKIKDDEKELLSKEYEEKISELIKNLKIKDDEKELLSKEYEEKISELIKNLKIKDDEKELLSKEYKEKNSELIKNLKTKDDEKELLSKEYETLKSEKEATDHKVVKFRMTVQQLDSEKMALMNEMNGVKRDNSELIRRLEFKKNEISAKVSEFEIKFEELTSDYEILEDQFKQSCTNLDFAHSKIAELETSLALANQRHKLEDEINVGRIKELLRERRGLEDILTVEFSRLNNVFRSTELEFEKTRGHLHSQLMQCREELQVVKEALVSKKHELMERAEHSRDEVKCLQGQLMGKTVEEEELKRKLVSMDLMLKEKEEEGKCKDEDKREAIRQLCFQIEYHRLNYDHLFQLLSDKMKQNR